MDLSDIKYSVDYKWLNNKALSSSNKNFDLSKIAERQEYFNEKVGTEISALKDFFKNHTFIAYWVAMKQAGKGTYMSMLREIFGSELFVHISVGDLVRETVKRLENEGTNSELYKDLEKVYRGPIPFKDIIDSLFNRSIATLLPDELILALLKIKVSQNDNKILFLDGFPRSKDQLSYSLFFRDLINYRDDPDLFFLINIPLQVIEDRRKNRVVCPKCGNSRNLTLLPTEFVGYDEQTGEFYLECDNPACNRERMVEKEGDAQGLELIKNRLINDWELMRDIRKFHGIDIIEVYNALEADKATQFVDDYELTKMFNYSLGPNKKVVVEESPYVCQDHGKDYVSLLAPAVTVQLIRQLAKFFDLV